MKKITVRFTEQSSTNKYTKKFDKLFDKLVPREGKAKTVEGEIIRAAAKVGYRWNNDGDKFYFGYGAETAGASATYLLKCGIEGMAKLISGASNLAHDKSSDAAYRKFIEAMAKLVVDYVESKDGKYTKNTKDNLDTTSNWDNDDADMSDEDYDEDENDYEVIMRKTVIANSSYTLDQMNSGFAYKDSMIKKIEKTISESGKGIGTSWERPAVKRFVSAELQGFTRVKQVGGYAAAKIAIGKAETFDQLKKAFEKLKTG
jgi:hypothetical protein